MLSPWAAVQPTTLISAAAGPASVACGSVVQDILELFAAGQSSEQILADFPDLEPEDLKAALAYAARQIDHPVLLG